MASTLKEWHNRKCASIWNFLPKIKLPLFSLTEFKILSSFFPPRNEINRLLIHVTFFAHLSSNQNKFLRSLVLFSFRIIHVGYIFGTDLFFLEMVMIVTSDGRIIIGKFIGHDQVQNLILTDAQERIYSDSADVEHVPLGLYVIRGDSLCLIGEYDKEILDNSDTLRVSAPLEPIQQHLM
jgi:U6 snRNA-associated Sm-like protein LSm8